MVNGSKPLWKPKRYVKVHKMYIKPKIIGIDQCERIKPRKEYKTDGRLHWRQEAKFPKYQRMPLKQNINHCYDNPLYKLRFLIFAGLNVLLI